MIIARLRVAAVPLVALAVLAGCSSSSSGTASTRVTLQQLRAAGSSCPLPLAAAIEGAGVRGGSAAPSTRVETSPGAGSVLQRVGGVSVQCTAPVSGGSVDVFLVAATKSAGAAATLLPRLQADGHLPVSALTSAGDDAATTKPGTLVPIAGSAPVALAVVTVDGARSAAFELHGAGLRKAVIDDIATRLAADLG